MRLNKSSFAVLVALGALALASQGALAAGPIPIPGEVLVSFEPGQRVQVNKNADGVHTGIAALDAVLDRHEVTDLESAFGANVDKFADPATRADLVRHYLVRHDNKTSNEALIADLTDLGMVASAESNLLLPMHGTAYIPNDLVGNQWYLRNGSTGGTDIRALGGWAESLGDSNVIVAVLDTGIDWHHPDLAGPHPDGVNGAFWTNWDEYYGSAGVDDDNNGFVDDIRGWDFVNVGSGDVWEGEDPGPPDNDPADFDGHGTAVSGCVAPLTDNGIGIAGTAPGCKIMGIRIGWHSDDGNGYSNAFYMAQGFNYATANGADVINLSYGTGYTVQFESAINAAVGNGIIICVSAGNDDNEDSGYLAGVAHPLILAVAATSSNDGKSDFSSYGTWVDVSAPGSEIYTTAYLFGDGVSSYTTINGTSFSSPITAGACALLLSALPELTPGEITQLLKDTCDPIDHLNPGLEGKLGAGRINLLRALGDNVQLVPQEFADFQDAMNEATPGDTIKLLATVELSQMVIMGKSLQVLGGYAPGYEDRDPLGTPNVVNGAINGPAMEFFGAVDQTTVVDGFVLQNGNGRTFADIPYAGSYGGGLVISNQSPTLRNLVIKDNSVGSASQLGCGGGILLNNSDSILENITITDNTAIYGGGVFINQGAPTFTNVTIDGNTVANNNLANPPHGGGVYIVDGSPTFTDVTVTNHLDAQKGGGIYAMAVSGIPALTMTGGEVSGNTAVQNGGGIHIENGSDLSLTDVVVTGNGPGTGATFMGGGGVSASATPVFFDGVTVADNEAMSGAGVQLATCPDVSIENSVFTGNATSIFGGTVYISSGADATLTNLTIADNSSANGGAGINAIATPISVSNTISAFNTGGAGTANGMAFSGTTPTLNCNDVFGNDGADYGGIDDPTGSDGNISVDPDFCDRPEGDYHVSPNGPCAPDNSGGCGLIGALDATCGSVNVVEDPDVPLAFAVEQNFPNPFNPSTTIRFALPATDHTRVAIFDLRGRHVRTLVDDNLVAATHTVQWHGDDDLGRQAAAGVYFYKVTSGQYEAVGRMALIK